MSERTHPAMVVVHTERPTAYALRVDGKIVGRHDQLGIEIPLMRDAPDGILGFMVRNGASLGKAARFLWDVKKDLDQRRAAGGLLHVSRAFDPEAYP